LAKILGTQGMGLSSMQTGNMAKFREEMDRHPNISKNTYYTISGTNWGPRRSILWCGGFYLSQYGANDGLINELSTHLSYAKHVFTGDLDHDLLRKGSAVWDKIEPVLKEGTELISLHEALLSPIPKVLASAEVNSQATRSENDQFVSGGELVGGQKKRIEVVLDSSEKTLFTIYCKSGDVHVSLRSPSGILYTKKSDQFTSCKGEDILSGMTVQSFQLSKPEVGNWEIHLVSKYKDAYLLTTSIIGKHTYSLDVPSIAKEEIPLQIQMGENADPNIQVGIKMIGPDNTQETKQLIIKKSSTKKFYGKVQVGNKRGVYNVVFVIKHKTKKGIAERTISRSIYVK
jgi:hypothetical protein